MKERLRYRGYYIQALREDLQSQNVREVLIFFGEILYIIDGSGIDYDHRVRNDENFHRKL